MGLAAVFFVTSITMTRLNNDSASQGSILEQQVDESGNPFDSLTTPPASGTATTPDPLGGTTTTPAPASPAPAAPDPLAPATNTTPAAPAPATTAPTTPAPTPENGGSPN